MTLEGESAEDELAAEEIEEEAARDAGDAAEQEVAGQLEKCADSETESPIGINY